MTKKRPIREGFVFAIIFIIVVVLVAIVTWWKGHEIIGWSVLSVLVVALAFFLYKSSMLRDWIGRQFKGVTERVVFEDVASDREPLPQDVRKTVLERARQRCENEQCGYQGMPVIHHIDMNNSNNRLNNLAALCPNCHQKAHNGVFTGSQLFNWVRRDYQRMKSRRAW
jgi:hypothetical protein